MWKFYISLSSWGIANIFSISISTSPKRDYFVIDHDRPTMASTRCIKLICFAYQM